MTDEVLIEELARAICKARYGHLRGYAGYREQYLREAQAILPIIHRREIEAGERVREAAAAEADANAHEECEVAEQIAKWVRALDVAAIVKGDSHD